MAEREREDQFLATIPHFAEFERVADAANYVALPSDWALATADIVGSTDAIAAGRYKSVNMAGASVISALLNAFGRRDFPFVFGGDGAMVAFPQSFRDAAANALAATRAWVSDELGLDLRAAIVPVADIRERGLEVRVALYSASPDVSYAMFSGGGASWAEAQMKAGHYMVAAATPGSRPDLSGLSCRWNPIEARRGEIVSIIAVPAGGPASPAFQRLVADIIALAEEQQRGGHPVPEEGPGAGWPPQGLDREARALAPAGRRLVPKLRILVQTALLMFSRATGIGIGPFDGRHYVREVVANSDFRKFDDGLKMTLDLDAAAVQRIEQRLRAAEAEGVTHYGLHRQNSALMTCIVTSPMQRDHIHFIDGAAGGYAVAASHLKTKVVLAA